MTCGEGQVSAKAAVGLAVLLIAAGVGTVLASPAKVETIEGSELKRVILDPKAAERLHIEMTPVREEKIVYTTVVPGEVQAESVVKAATVNSSNSAATRPAPLTGGKTRVLVLLDDDDVDDGDDDTGDVDDEDHAEILAPGDDDDDEPLLAKRVAMTSQVTTDANTLYFKIPADAHHNLRPGQRVGVKLAVPNESGAKKVIPYSAVLYDAHGDAWVYTSPEPLTFVRERVTIDKIDRGRAALQEGPAVGTQVVTVGAAELYGAESGVGH